MTDFWPGRPEWFKNSTRRLIFDSCCILCARRGQLAKDLCISCEKLLTERLIKGSEGFTSCLCTGCGIDFKASDLSFLRSNLHYCAKCRSNDTPLMKMVVAPYRYVFPLDKLIQRMKYHSDRNASRVLGALLADSVKACVDAAELPDFLLPMPLHPARQSQRGFNQAEDIARWCGRALKLPVRPASAARVIDTPSMAGFGRAERQYRILGAFRAAESVYGKHIAIVDDVLTTGSTTRELARELYDTGAESVDLWVLARTSSPRAND